LKGLLILYIKKQNMNKVSRLTMYWLPATMLLALVTLPLLASAQVLPTTGALAEAFKAIVTFIQQILIPFLFAIGFFMFVWGVIKFFVIGGNNDDAKAEGKSLIIYALAGFVVILIFWGLVNIVAGGIGLSNQDIKAPKVKVNTP